MRKIFPLLLFIVYISTNAQSQKIGRSPEIPQIPVTLNDSLFPTYYRQRVSLFRTLPVKTGQVVFLGNSITDGAEWNELFDNDPNIINRGISGDITAGVLNRLDEVVVRKPSKIFLLIGTNDLADGIKIDSVEKNIFLIAEIIHAQTPLTKLYIQSITPVNSYYHMFGTHTTNGAVISQINANLKSSAAKYNYTFLNIHDLFTDKEDKFNTELTNDGLHLKGDAYEIWKHFIYPYVYDLQTRPALLPLPKEITWRDDFFPVYRCTSITIDDDSLKSMAKDLQKIMTDNGSPISIKKFTGNITTPAIHLSIKKNQPSQPSDESYTLEVNKTRLSLTANSLHGLFNGIQTLRQLMRNKSTVESCLIKDAPAFPWRGYMVDVGRNYQSMDLLKQQIDVLASLKMNIFHFHLTEDVAWRLQIKRYPELTAAKNMTRNKGQFYSEKDLKELITYCKQRFITLIPEIDMPGHSAAFKRAMGFDMQSDSGVLVMKNILTEICETYDIPYIHIGADEVHITNKGFVPAMISLIEAKGKKVIGWSPGGNLTPSAIRQLWGDHIDQQADFKEIDSRNLYINHMDAEESVVSIFNHEICDIPKGNAQKLGGTLCLWNDRRLSTEEENLTHNPTYPAILAFAEKLWRGGGTRQNNVFLANKDTEEYKDFTAFESRLLDIKKEFFTRLPFPYIKQANIHWQLIGPYNNNGNLSTSFAPESTGFNAEKADNAIPVMGGTIILRHFWAPIIKGILARPTENSTYYAYAKYWSDVDTTAQMWIGLYDFSRSTQTDPPKENTWNNLQGKIWLNNHLIAPPDWQQGGQAGDLEIPYSDENYYSRKPAVVHLNKGWNKLLIKLPVGKFDSGLWYAPVKWMFTAIFVTKQQEGMNFIQDENVKP